MKKTVLIAGGSGFLGSHLCDYYTKGYRVVCVDNLSTGFERNISHLRDSGDFKFINHDIVKLPNDEILNEKYDIVINMASPASPPGFQRLAIETLDAGSVGTKNMLEIAKRDGARFFQASTSEIYGDPEIHPQPENYWGNANPYGPRSMYDEAKRFGEALVYSYREKYGLNTVIARIFNTYGPRMDENDGRVISNFITQALDGGPMTIYGDGKQTRSFCYVDDLIQSITLLISSDLEGPINIGSPNEFTVLELADLINKGLSGVVDLEFHELPRDDPKQRKPDITKATKELGWEPEIDLKEGLSRTTEYFKSLR